jgi:hypothetical protein
VIGRYDGRVQVNGRDNAAKPEVLAGLRTRTGQSTISGQRDPRG